MEYVKTDLWSEKQSRKKYLILAGKNKQDRQLYLTDYKDCDDWMISIVAIPMSKNHALNLIKRVKKELVELTKINPRKYPKDLVFELQETKNQY